jgi:hypothetical protein
MPTRRFIRRLLVYAALALAVTADAWVIGIPGYHFAEGMPLLDSLVNASMIPGGMGPVDPLKTDAGKLFASFYALFSGMAFLGIAGILVAPAVQRFPHRMHLETGDKTDGDR